MLLTFIESTSWPEPVLPNFTIYCDGKQYTIKIVGDEEHGYKVEYSYGTLDKLVTKVKNASPVRLEQAELIYEKMKKEQRKKLDKEKE